MVWKRFLASGFFFVLGLIVIITGANITGGVTGVADWQDSYYIFFAAILFFTSGFFVLLSYFFDKNMRFDREEPPKNNTDSLSSYKSRKFSDENRKSSNYQ